ncbi:hypothetical protein HK097_006958 [Rhizophlyctis rosea]|uniref:Uncharacterized protein n=1 Tax=Rhizophlyctis rosea TaxID=64517 RepID=A0AAD5X4Y2_9FUNG|nr:hypothetical protein HK097_006958 [Rhizophlyctis rosea]
MAPSSAPHPTTSGLRIRKSARTPIPAKHFTLELEDIPSSPLAQQTGGKPVSEDPDAPVTTRPRRTSRHHIRPSITLSSTPSQTHIATAAEGKHAHRRVSNLRSSTSASRSRSRFQTATPTTPTTREVSYEEYDSDGSLVNKWSQFEEWVPLPGTFTRQRELMDQYRQQAQFQMKLQELAQARDKIGKGKKPENISSLLTFGTKPRRLSNTEKDSMNTALGLSKSKPSHSRSSSSKAPSASQPRKPQRPTKGRKTLAKITPLYSDSDYHQSSEEESTDSSSPSAEGSSASSDYKPLSRRKPKPSRCRRTQTLWTTRKPRDSKLVFETPEWEVEDEEVDVEGVDEREVEGRKEEEDEGDEGGGEEEVDSDDTDWLFGDD